MVPALDFNMIADFPVLEVTAIAVRRWAEYRRAFLAAAFALSGRQGSREQFFSPGR
jgi:hypothetical protein